MDKCKCFSQENIIDLMQLLLSNFNGGSGSSSIIEIYQVDHNFVEGNVLYLKDDGTYDLALCEDTKRVEVVGIVSKVINEDEFEIILSGFWETNIYDTDFIEGDVLYLSESESKKGTLINNPSKFLKPIAIKITDGIIINIQRASASKQIVSGGGASVDIEYYTDQQILDMIDEIWS